MNEPIQFLINHGEAALFAFVLIEQAGLPLPAAPLLLAAGALGAGGKLNVVATVALVTNAAMLADLVWFYIGRRSGPRVLRLFCRLSLARSSCVGRSRNLFERHGLQALVAAKFLPGLGTVMPPLAGAMGMSTTRFLLFDSVGSLFYGTFYIAVGFIFHSQLQQVMGVLAQLGLGALLLMLFLAAAYVVLKYVRRRVGSNRNPQLDVRPDQSPEAAPAIPTLKGSHPFSRRFNLSPQTTRRLRFDPVAQPIFRRHQFLLQTQSEVDDL